MKSLKCHKNHDEQCRQDWGKNIPHKQGGEMGFSRAPGLLAVPHLLSGGFRFPPAMDPGGLFPCLGTILTLHRCLPCPTVSGWKSILVKCPNKGGSRVTNLSQSAQKFPFLNRKSCVPGTPQSWDNQSSWSHWEAGNFQAIVSWKFGGLSRSQVPTATP